MTVDCSTCFNKTHYPDSVLSIICYRCKEQKMCYYRSDLSDITRLRSIEFKRKEDMSELKRRALAIVEIYSDLNRITEREADILHKAITMDRPQGEWIYRQEWFEDEKEPRMAWGCNQCGFSIKSVHEKRNFCPNCGAEMKEGDK